MQVIVKKGLENVPSNRVLKVVYVVEQWLLVNHQKYLACQQWIINELLMKS